MEVFKDKTIKEFIVSSNKLTSKMLQETFKDVSITNAKKSEQKKRNIIYNWINILDEVESGVANKLIKIDIGKA